MRLYSNTVAFPFQTICLQLYIKIEYSPRKVKER